MGLLQGIGRALHPVCFLVPAALPMATHFHSLLGTLQKPAAEAALRRGFANAFRQPPGPRSTAPQHVTRCAPPCVLRVKMASVSVKTILETRFVPPNEPDFQAPHLPPYPALSLLPRLVLPLCPNCPAFRNSSLGCDPAYLSTGLSEDGTRDVLGI